MQITDWLPKKFASVFNLMSVAEEAIAAAKVAHPESAKAIDEAFPVLCPTRPLIELGSEEVYRAHAGELLDRVVKGERVEEGTDAEVLCLLSMASLRAPMSTDRMVLMTKLFASIIGEDRLPPGEVNEPWAGASDELRLEIRRQLRSKRGVEDGE